MVHEECVVLGTLGQQSPGCLNQLCHLQGLTKEIPWQSGFFPLVEMLRTAGSATAVGGFIQRGSAFASAAGIRCSISAAPNLLDDGFGAYLTALDDPCDP